MGPSFTDPDNIPPAPDQLTKDIWEVQFPYLIKNPGVCEGIDIGYRAAMEALDGYIKSIWKQKAEDLQKSLEGARRALNNIANEYDPGTTANMIAVRAIEELK